MNSVNYKALTLLIAASILVMTVIQPAEARDRGREPRIKIMTQNVYVGSNLFQLLDAQAPEEIPLIAAQVFSDIQTTNIHQRVDELAKMIAIRRPHLIGLQEVALLRTECPSSLVVGDPPGPNATDLYADYLEILLSALDARGAHYEVAAMVENFDVELPAANSPGVGPLAECPYPLFDARLTDFDVTLRRVDVHTNVILEKRFGAVLPVPTAAGDIPFYRGFTVVSAEIGGVTYAFTNTHLETDTNPFASLFQFLQAQELTATLNAIPALNDMTQIVVGDFNSSPDKYTADCFVPDLGVVVPDGCPTAYAMLVANGYADAWDLRRWRRHWRWQAGLTCCHDPLLDNIKPALTRRIDQIWLRDSLSGSGPRMTDKVFTSVVGTQRFNKTPDGRWPSDHAGVYSVIKYDND